MGSRDASLTTKLLLFVECIIDALRRRRQQQWSAGSQNQLETFATTSSTMTRTMMTMMSRHVSCDGEPQRRKLRLQSKTTTSRAATAAQ